MEDRRVEAYGSGACREAVVRYGACGPFGNAPQLEAAQIRRALTQISEEILIFGVQITDRPGDRPTAHRCEGQLCFKALILRLGHVESGGDIGRTHDLEDIFLLVIQSIVESRQVQANALVEEFGLEADFIGLHRLWLIGLNGGDQIAGASVDPASVVALAILRIGKNVGRELIL